MYRAKEQGRNGYTFYSADLSARAFEHLSLERGLRGALQRDEFTLYYQPRVALETGKIIGVEALIRWRHPRRGLVMPDTFINVAEETGLIEPIGEWVLRRACAQIKAWRDQGLPPLRLAVNVSGRQISRANFLQRVETILADSGLAKGELELELEITESLLQAAEQNVAVLTRLKAFGATLAIDDFGTGYSSLSHLKYLPVDTLKIDKSFVQGIPCDLNDDAIATAIIAMGHSLGLRIVGEGVETEEQLAFLRSRGCDEFQGYLFSKTVPPEVIGHMIKADHSIATLH